MEKMISLNEHIEYQKDIFDEVVYAHNNIAALSANTTYLLRRILGSMTSTICDFGSGFYSTSTKIYEFHLKKVDPSVCEWLSSQDNADAAKDIINKQSQHFEITDITTEGSGDAGIVNITIK